MRSADPPRRFPAGLLVGLVLGVGPVKEAPSEFSREHAARLGVSLGALEAAWQARQGCYQASDEGREALVEGLRVDGDELLIRTVQELPEGAANFWSAAEALGQLGESKGADAIRLETFTRPGWEEEER